MAVASRRLQGRLHSGFEVNVRRVRLELTSRDKGQTPPVVRGRAGAFILCLEVSCMG